MIKRYLERMFIRAATLNNENISNMFENNPKARFLDLGCDDGRLTKIMAKSVGTKDIFGVEIDDSKIILAKINGVTVRKNDLNKKLSFENDLFDVIHANQVIEHIFDSDNFMSEIKRILKPGGYAIISTENASSWCNIVASIFGWQIFSLTNFSSIAQGIGNPFALHKGETNIQFWNHVRIYNINGLKEYFRAYGFRVQKVKGAGYFPLPGIIGNIDKSHSHFMTFKVRKPIKQNSIKG